MNDKADKDLHSNALQKAQTVMTAPSPRSILIVTVQYGNVADTKAFVASVANARNSHLITMVIVDNGREANDELERLAKTVAFPVQIVRPKRNLYYWGGAAYALELVSKANHYRWTIVCNNDVLLESPDFFQRLDALDPAQYPIIGPEIVDSQTGRHQNPLLAQPPRKFTRLRWRLFDSHYVVAKTMLLIDDALRGVRAKKAGLDARRLDAVEQRIYAPHGACVILSSAFFERGGVLDATLPMYAEELTLAATAERLGIDVWYRPDLKIVHNAHSTTGAHLTREKYQMERAARRRFFALRDDAVHF